MRLLLLLALLAGCTPLAESPSQREAELAPDWRLLRPDADGPVPAALLLSGCDGVHDNMDYWARAFVAEGRAALIVDSHAPRDLDDHGAWRLVCSALALRGPARAGDVAVALDALAHDPGIDATDVVILGASHGGWAAMEFMGHALTGAPLPGLDRWPEPPEAMRRRVTAMVLLYPYCGVLNDARAGEWASAPPTLMVLSGEDHVVSTPRCLARAEALRGTGALLTTAVLPGADHAYDQQDKAPTSRLPFDPALRDRVRGAVERWLRRVGAAG